MPEKRDVTINNRFGKHIAKVEIRRKRIRPAIPFANQAQSAEFQALALKKKQEAIRKATESPGVAKINVVNNLNNSNMEELEAQKRKASFFGDRQLMNAIAAQTRKNRPQRPPLSQRPPLNMNRAPRPLKTSISGPNSFVKTAPARPTPIQLVRKQQTKRPIPRFGNPQKSFKKIQPMPNANIGRTFLGRIESEDDVTIHQERFRSIAAFRRSQQKQRGSTLDSVVREITVFDGMPVVALAHAMAIPVDSLLNKLKDFDIRSEKAGNLDLDTCCIIVEEFGHKYKKRVEILDKVKRDFGEEGDYLPRSPIVTVVGHVDHGKTSLLDALRNTNVVNKESGGITQGIGASQVFTKDGRFITFIDTPGHEIFDSMRARGVELTDIVLLIIAADEGIQDQTIESIQHIQSSKAFLIVVFTKIDKPGGNVEKIKQMLMRYNIAVQSSSGNVPDIEVSSKTGKGLTELLQLILDSGELLDLKANPKPKASGIILEGTMDKHRGPLGTLIVLNGNLKKSDPFLSGSCYGKVRAMIDWQGKQIEIAGPSMPIQIMGFDKVPNAGDDFIVIEESAAKEAAAKRQDIQNVSSFALSKAEMVYSVMDIWNEIAGDQSIVMPFVIKADSYGSAEAIAGAINKISYPNVIIEIKLKGIGSVTDTDLDLAKTAGAMIIAFKVDIKPTLIKNAATWGVKVKRYDIIYQILDDINANITSTLEPKEEEVMLGQAEIREIYEKPKIGKIAGCFVQDGIIKREAKAILMRNGIQVYCSTIQSIRQLRDDRHEVKAGQECGIIMSKFSDYKIGDTIQCFEMRKIN